MNCEYLVSLFIFFVSIDLFSFFVFFVRNGLELF